MTGEIATGPQELGRESGSSPGTSAGAVALEATIVLLCGCALVRWPEEAGRRLPAVAGAFFVVSGIYQLRLAVRLARLPGRDPTLPFRLAGGAVKLISGIAGLLAPLTGLVSAQSSRLALATGFVLAGLVGAGGALAAARAGPPNRAVPLSVSMANVALVALGLAWHGEIRADDEDPALLGWIAVVLAAILFGYAVLLAHHEREHRLVSQKLSR